MSARSVLEANLKSAEADVAYHAETLRDAERQLAEAKAALDELDTMVATRQRSAGRIN